MIMLTKPSQYISNPVPSVTFARPHFPVCSHCMLTLCWTWLNSQTHEPGGKCLAYIQMDEHSTLFEMVKIHLSLKPMMVTLFKSKNQTTISPTAKYPKLIDFLYSTSCFANMIRFQLT